MAMRQNGAVYYLLSDHPSLRPSFLGASSGQALGSTSITADSSGTRTGELMYKPWGEIRYTWGATPTTYRFTGQREQAEIGLYYYGARWYDPSLGRWAQPDTVLAGALNVQAWDRYMYSNNNPAVYIDPSGHFSVNIFNNGGAACGVDGSFCMRSGLSKQIQLKTIAAAASVSCDTCGKSSEGYGDMGRAYDVFSQVETILGRPLTYNEVLTVTAQEEFGVLADDPTQYTRALEAEGRQFYELCGAGGICEGEELWRFLGSQQGWTGADPNEIADAINGGLDESAGETITDQAPWNPYQSDTTSWRSGSGNGNVPFKYGNYSMLPDAAQKALPIAHEGWEDYQLAVNNPLNKYVVMTMNQYYYWKDYD
jgi:RHS repeat-associated protein